VSFRPGIEFEYRSHSGKKINLHAGKAENSVEIVIFDEPIF
jgi:hypothetical protein